MLIDVAFEKHTENQRMIEKVWLNVVKRRGTVGQESGRHESSTRRKTSRRLRKLISVGVAGDLDHMGVQVELYKEETHI